MFSLSKLRRFATALVVTCVFFVLHGSPMYAQATLPVMPLPAHVVQGAGSLSLHGGLQVVFEGYTEPRLERARDRFVATLSRETGILPVPPQPVNQSKLIIKTAGPSAPVQQLGEDESYRLEITPTQAVLNAANPLGILRGLQTFLQLAKISPNGFVVPAITIDDQPRFPWRGLMLDSGRHFMPVDVVRQTLDGMEAVKMNVFHWHLSEDQGFRIESKTFPLLQEKGSDGLFYTQEQVREIIDYARDRGIRVIPEFDMPGHATAWFVGYPNIASGNGPYQIEREFGIFDPAMDPTRESTYEFLDRFIEEMTALFPDAYFHIGGDECNGKEWDRNPRIQQFMREHGLKDDAALQAYFTGRVQKLVAKRGKITVGWDEVLQPDTPKDVVIQSWRGQKSLAQAAERGNRGILSTGYYIDLNQPASQHYAVDPLEGATAKLTADQQKNILGGEATMWSEYTTPENVGGRIWPRTAAIAERLWSPQETKDVDSMYRRLGVVSEDLAQRGMLYRTTSELMIERMVGDEDPSSLKVLASVVEPPKGYSREELTKYYSYTPLNHLVDAVPSESDQARQFRGIADRIAGGTATENDRRQARQWLTLWRDNDALLQPLLPHSALTAELAPLSRNLSQAAAIGLSALDSLEKRESVSAATRGDQLASLKKLGAPQATLIDGIVPGVETLVRATKR
ncbi:Beta-hexosaminidase [Acidisarcina polymorpha]|uniref:Beta-hexosaminidase n=1 Tax=Acidisarcina polymorpha TaxID=2211140 RepID=A0A2Z5G5Y6_9BACT|nr:family 20 glycosylhydrolase [Acidisarcina polymorpha]AXC14154.1 Beta-hexosaminidase [Acidisarcina polymorpha]